MYVGRWFDPSDTEESEPYSFDFTRDFLEPGEEITTAVWSLEVARASPITDPDPASHLIGFPVNAGVVSTQRIQGLIPRCIYAVKAIATTNVGNVRSLWSYIETQEQK